MTNDTQKRISAMYSRLEFLADQNEESIFVSQQRKETDVRPALKIFGIHGTPFKYWFASVHGKFTAPKVTRIGVFESPFELSEREFILLEYLTKRLEKIYK